MGFSFIHSFMDFSWFFSFEYCLELFKEQCSGILCWEKRILSTKLALKSLLLPPSLLSLPLSMSSRLVCPFNLEKRLRKENERCWSLQLQLRRINTNLYLSHPLCCWGLGSLFFVHTWENFLKSGYLSLTFFFQGRGTRQHFQEV